MSADQILSRDVLDRISLPDLQRLERDYQEAVREDRSRIVVLDDDPTGVQTVHGVSVYTDWSGRTFSEAFEEESREFFILTNSRSMSGEQTGRVHREIGQRIAEAIRENGGNVQIISRSDSTLRGHYPAETETLREAIEAECDVRFDGEIICPFFREGGRFTIHGVHYVQERERLVPAGMTEFARDKTFGYQASHLGAWVEEKSGGKFKQEECAYISLEDLRSLNYEKITDALMKASGFQKIIVDGVDYCDIQAFAVAYFRACRQGKHFIIRSAAAVPKVLGGITDQPLLRREQLLTGDSPCGGILVVGSYVNKTTRQLEALMRSGLPVTYIEFNAESALTEGGLQRETARVFAEAEELIRKGKHVAVYTSRKLLTDQTMNRERQLALSVGISDALTSIVGALTVQPKFIVAKGGITSSDIGTKALKVHRATVMGQVKPGIPVWLTGAESKFPQMPYVIFPGNVGGEETLKEIMRELVGSSD